MREFYKFLNQKHRVAIADLVIANLPQVDRRANDNDAKNPPPAEPLPEEFDSRPDAMLGCDPGAYPKCWDQDIEFYTNPFYNAKLPNSYYQLATACDDDTSDNDLILYYAYSYMGNPNGLMWGTNDQRIASVAFTYPNWRGYGLNTNNSDVRLCIPERISGVFSINTILNQIFITRNFTISQAKPLTLA